MAKSLHAGCCEALRLRASLSFWTAAFMLLMVAPTTQLFGARVMLPSPPPVGSPPPPLFQLPNEPLPEYPYPTTPLIPSAVHQWAYNVSGDWGVPLLAPCNSAGDTVGTMCHTPISYLDQRFWRAEDLTAGLWAHGLAQFRPLLAKLHRGEPITVVAYGSSITLDYGGCSGTPEHVRPRVRRLPYAYAHGNCRGDQWYSKNGWLSNFMQLLNATWPHPGHMLVNAGRGGQNLAVTLRSCAEDYVPEHVDLYILENVDTRTPVQQLEQVLWQVLRTASGRGDARPAIVIINADAAIANNVPQIERCILDEQKCYQCSEGSATPFSNFTQADGELFRTWFFSTHSPMLANYYGVTLFSMRQFYASFIHDEYPQDWSICGLLTRTFLDGMHPSLLGRVLYADALVNVLRLAEQHAARHPAARVPQVPQRPLYGPGGRDVRLTRCLMVDDDELEQGMATYEGLNIVRNEGWRFVETYTNPITNQVKYKPGYVADVPGAVFEVQLDTTWAANLTRPNTSMLVVTYLTSYEHMGVASVSCLRDCACEPLDINAHRPPREGSDKGASMHEQFMVRVSDAPRCVVQLQVQQASSSGGHRFKLINLMVMAVPVDGGGGGQRLRFPPFQGYGPIGGDAGATDTAQ